jgi:hypothetical protein
VRRRKKRWPPCGWRSNGNGARSVFKLHSAPYAFARISEIGMHDPRTPEILAWLDAMPLAKRLTVTQAMAFAFPPLKNDRDWQARLNALLDERKPTVEEHADIVIEAGKISGRLKRTLGR